MHDENAMEIRGNEFKKRVLKAPTVRYIQGNTYVYNVKL